MPPRRPRAAEGIHVNRRILFLATLLAFLTGAPLALATHPAPPPFYNCIGSYNPSAMTNVCYSFNLDPSVTVGEGEQCAYVIGYLPGCVEYPWLPVEVDGPVHVFVQGPLCTPGNHDTPLYCHTLAA